MYMPFRAASTLTLALSILLPPSILAAQQPEPTRVLVRAVARDAKIIGSGVGGARITVRDAETGRVLAEGVQAGSTGDTDRIMRTPRARDATVFDTEGAAGFVAELSLAAPTVVDIIAEGPLDTPHATTRSSKRMLLVPGRHVLGEGVILELNGFTVELLAPEGMGVDAGEPVPVRARVTMLCGCPTEPGGLWDADDIDIRARLLRDGRPVLETTLRFAGETSTYQGTLTPPSAGDYTLEVLAMDGDNANFGRVTAALRAH